MIEHHFDPVQIRNGWDWLKVDVRGSRKASIDQMNQLSCPLGVGGLYEPERTTTLSLIASGMEWQRTQAAGYEYQANDNPTGHSDRRPLS